MNPTFAAGMEEATRLTRSGRLAEATALIQRLLQGGQGREAPPSAARPDSGGAPTIDAEYVVLDTADPARPGTDARHDPQADARPRAGLAETLRRLKERAGRGRPATVGDPLPAGASFLAGSFTNAAGTRAYKLYVPASRPAGPAPLIVMLHGCTQDPDDFAAGTRMNALAEEHGFLVAYPAQDAKANAQRCWNWFAPDDQERDRGEPSLLAGIVRKIVHETAVDPARIYVAGLSAGGAAAAVMAAAYPDLIAAVGVHSGLPVGAARDLPSAFAAMRQGVAAGSVPGFRPVPAIVFHGDEDRTVHPRNGDAVAAQFAVPASRARSTVETRRAAGGLAYSRTVHAGADGRTLGEHWTVHGAGHAWSGGSPQGSHTDPRGPDASREMVRFFLQQRLHR